MGKVGLRKSLKNDPPECEVFILAGGLSSRMGRDKSGVRLGAQTMLQHVRETVREAALPVRTIRRDAVPRCGPLGGIYTALKRSRARAVMILACDMPFVSVELLRKMLAVFHRGNSGGLFAAQSLVVGFPCVLNREICLTVVAEQIASSNLSLHGLAKALRAKTLKLERFNKSELTNINTPAELATEKKKLTGG